MVLVSNALQLYMPETRPTLNTERHNSELRDGILTITRSCPETCEPLEWTVTDSAKPIVILCTKCSGTTRGDPTGSPSSWSRGASNIMALASLHDDFIKWKRFPRYWPFVWGNHRSPVNSLHRSQWGGALLFSLICAWKKRLSKQKRCWWFATPSSSLWHHGIVNTFVIYLLFSCQQSLYLS